MKLLKSFIRIVLSVYFIFAIVLFVFQRNFLYYPTAKVIHDHEVQQYGVGENVLDVVVLNQGNENAIIYFGGNAESVVNNAKSFSQIFINHTVYLVNYRGYGGSTGKPTEKNLYSDAHYLYDVFSKQHNQISVIGRSLGTGVATFLASTRAIYKMVLITPYDSIQNIAQSRYPVYPISLMLKDKFDSASRIKDISASTLVILAEYDAVIPLKNSQQLIEKFPASQVQVETVNGDGHNNLSGNARYYYLLQQFMGPS
ncbi:MAG: alpha/beta hydrolase [Proteobacteria bacterium]|nr:alpha/beta hydrolase [Pseudomonadota bacterium]NOG60077.1 alpha/beta hydrolase [Pseudomonadota bacterium]